MQLILKPVTEAEVKNIFEEVATAQNTSNTKASATVIETTEQ